MKRIKLIIAGAAVALFGTLALVPVTPAAAIDPLGTICDENPSSEVCQSSSDDANKLIRDLINVLLFIVGALAVIMIIVGGILYVISAGDPGKVTRAKNTLVYAIVGLVVALVAYAIVNFVILKLPTT